MLLWHYEKIQSSGIFTITTCWSSKQLGASRVVVNITWLVVFLSTTPLASL